MPPVGTEQKWHSIESGIVVRVCKSGLIFSNKNAFILKKTDLFSQVIISSSKTLKNRQLAHLLSADLEHLVV